MTHMRMRWPNLQSTPETRRRDGRSHIYDGTRRRYV